MAPPPFQCPKCKTALLDGVFNVPELRPCPHCQNSLQIELFPAFFRPPPPVRSGELIFSEGEASCFYHPEKRAQVPCGECGRFLCALCDCEVRGEHLCPACLEAGCTRGRAQHLAIERTLYDSMALSLAVLPLVLVLTAYFTIVTAPCALYMAIRYWRAPLGLVRRSRFRFVLAVILAVLQLIGWAVGVGAFVYHHRQGYG